MAHSGQELMRVNTIYYYAFLLLLIYFALVLFLLSLLLLPAASSWGRLPFLAGEVGCLFCRR